MQYALYALYAIYTYSLLQSAHYRTLSPQTLNVKHKMYTSNPKSLTQAHLVLAGLNWVRLQLCLNIYTSYGGESHL